MSRTIYRVTKIAIESEWCDDHSPGPTANLIKRVMRYAEGTDLAEIVDMIARDFCLAPGFMVSGLYQRAVLQEIRSLYDPRSSRIRQYIYLVHVHLEKATWTPIADDDLANAGIEATRKEPHASMG